MRPGACARPTSRQAWEICLRGARVLDLVFTAVDLRRRPDGGFVALEFNPAPAVAFFEDPREGRILHRLGEWLVAHA